MQQFMHIYSTLPGRTRYPMNDPVAADRWSGEGDSIFPSSQVFPRMKSV
jgi:hypothetical protein